jgi:beta-glucanase (GH16 family)
VRTEFTAVLARFAATAEWRGAHIARLLLAALTTIASGCGGGSSNAVLTPSPPPVYAGPGTAAISDAGGLPSGYSLVWADEFDVDGLPDGGKWTYDLPLAGASNHELQYYTDSRPENSRVENGNLVIEARHEDMGDQHYTSARLVTRGKASWTHAFVEVRARLPCGIGTWPAIWMLAATPVLHWPADGEIDIMEHVGFEQGVIHGTVHTTDFNSRLHNERTATTPMADVCTAFHRYQLTWTPTRILIGMDDHNYFQYSNDGSGKAEWPFDGPQYMVLNIAIGGDWGGQHGVDDTIFPVRMEIDYVRIYQQ